MEQHDDPTRASDPEVVERLRALGHAPLDPTVARRCATRMRNDGRRRTTLRRAGVIGALAATMVVGSVGLAAADTLPSPVQEVAHDALGKVGVNVPPGHDRYNDPTACPDGPYRNHGAYVRAHKGDPNAAHSPCG